MLHYQNLAPISAPSIYNKMKDPKELTLSAINEHQDHRLLRRWTA